MYLNVISFTNGKMIQFQSKVPYSIDQLADGWNVVSDEVNGQIVNFKADGVVTIASTVIPSGKAKSGVMTAGIVKQ